MKRCTSSLHRVEAWPTACALFRMADPQPVKRGQTYKNGTTGRDAYSVCDIDEI